MLSIDDIATLFARRGHEQYAGEPVTQLEHALQTALLAEQAGADDELVTACLLHDLGHLTQDLGESPTLRGVDDVHQYAAIPFLRGQFGERVLGGVQLHVDAKRYLCATVAGYEAALSADSQRSLKLQGGVFNAQQAAEFGVTPKQSLAGLLMFITDVHSLGLKVTQNMYLTEGFYWNLNDETRAWSKRFFDQHKRMPTMVQAGQYSSVMHYLKAVQAAGTDEAQAVMRKMRETPINDFFAKDGKIREDGRMVHDMYVYEVKKPSESKGDWDFYKLREVIPGDQAFRPLKDSACPLVKKG